MRIIGKGRDYYDGAMAFGADKELVFMRSRMEDTDRLPSEKCELRRPADRTVRIRKSGSRNSRILECHLIVVIFGGVRYPGIEVPMEGEYFGQSKISHVWNRDAFEALLAGNQYEMIDAQRRGDDEFFRYAGMTTLDKHFDDEISKVETLWMIENGKSIAIWNYDPYCIGSDRGGWSWVFDCDGLSNIDFAKALDPYGAFQSLSQWVGGVLPRNGKETIQLTDTDLAKKHGYNHWSFRKPPQAKRR